MPGEKASGNPLKYTYDRYKSQKPRRNKSAFLIFSSEKRAQLKANKGKNLNSNQTMSILADLWNNLPHKERRKYEQEAEKEKDRYLQEMEAFRKENPSAKESRNKTQKNHVKKPTSAYGLFLKETSVALKEGNPGLLMADILKIVSQRWKNMSENEKLLYKEKAQKEKEMSQARLKHKLLESYHIVLPEQQLMAEQTEKITKQVKRKSSETVSTNSNTHSLYTVSYEQETHENLLMLPNTFQCNNYDSVQQKPLLINSPFQTPQNSAVFNQEAKEDNRIWEQSTFTNNFGSSNDFYRPLNGEGHSFIPGDNSDLFNLNFPKFP